MLMIVSRRERAIPAARTAPNDEPYSTSRSRSRSYQTRCGMRWTSGCAPVAIDERHTGVSEGNVEIAREYDPCSARNESAGARPSPTAASNTDGVSPSMTMRMSFSGPDDLIGGRAGREHQAGGRTQPQQGWTALLRARVDSGAA